MQPVWQTTSFMDSKNIAYRTVIGRGKLGKLGVTRVVQRMQMNSDNPNPMLRIYTLIIGCTSLHKKLTRLSSKS